METYRGRVGDDLHCRDPAGRSCRCWPVMVLTWAPGQGIVAVFRRRLPSPRKISEDTANAYRARSLRRRMREKREWTTTRAGHAGPATSLSASHPPNVVDPLPRWHGQRGSSPARAGRTLDHGRILRPGCDELGTVRDPHPGGRRRARFAVADRTVRLPLGRAARRGVFACLAGFADHSW